MKKITLLRFLKLIYLKLFRINDTPQKIAFGFGIGTFAGITPGIGPLAALFLAFILRANRASAILGALITNTWLSFFTFVLSIKIGSAILGLKGQDIYKEWMLILKNFHLSSLFKLSVLKIALPVILGYLVVAFIAGLIVYLITLVILTLIKHENQSRARLPG